MVCFKALHERYRGKPLQISVSEIYELREQNIKSQNYANMSPLHKRIYLLQSFFSKINIQAICVEVSESLRQFIRTERPSLRPQKWILHHGNSPSHATYSVNVPLARKQIRVLEHPPSFRLTFRRMNLSRFREQKLSYIGYNFSHLKTLSEI
jgi:hypothetical protein